MTMATNTHAITVGRNIRFLRLRAGLTQAGLAETAGIGQTYVGQIERAEKNVSLEVLGEIAAALGVTMADLLRTPPPPREALVKELERSVA